MTQVSAANAGTFTIGGQLTVNRLGYGAMRITGPGVWGWPTDLHAARQTLAQLPELGINFVDTADSYGPLVSEQLIREVLHPYEGMVVATKAGLTRPGPDQWVPRGDPDYLIAQAKQSRDTLGVERIALWQLHRIDPTVPRDEQFAAVRDLLRDGVIAHAGLSEVTVADIVAAQEFFPVATVQNRFNLVDRGSEAVLNHCEQHGIGFIPWFPLAAGRLVRSDGPLERMARRYDASSSQIALAWVLKRSPVMLPIPGTANASHLRENVAAAAIALSPGDFDELDAAATR